MIECYNCEYEFSEEDREYTCPFCGETDMGEGYCRCENCDALMTPSGDMWECEYCGNEGKTQPAAVIHDDEDCWWDDEYCEDGIPDVNQGWVGENYG